MRSMFLPFGNFIRMITDDESSCSCSSQIYVSHKYQKVNYLVKQLLAVAFTVGWRCSTNVAHTWYSRESVASNIFLYINKLRLQLPQKMQPNKQGKTSSNKCLYSNAGNASLKTFFFQCTFQGRFNATSNLTPSSLVNPYL